MVTVTLIPAKKRVGSRPVQDAAPKVRVAAYCRVSTDSDEQATSYEAQIEHYQEYIRKNSAWEFAGIYADDGISGTNTKKREEFNRLINDCMDGKIDLVITKSISRFARNTLDCLNYIRMLKDKNIAVFFEKENINTLDAKGEIMITIMASLAQQESQSLSQNVSLGLQYRYQQGKVQVCTNRFLGYDKDQEGKLIINPVEAEVVRRIYREYLEGKSYRQIGDGLTADGIRTAAGGEHWHSSTLKTILSNEKYIGDALLQKTVTTDFLAKKRVRNKGIAPQYYVEECHEAIIPRDVYMQVQVEMVRRVHMVSANGRRHLYSGKYALSSIVYCAHCGNLFQRTTWSIRGEKRVVWRCHSRLHKKENGIGCPARTIDEAQLHEAVVQAVNEFCAGRDSFLPQLKKNIEKAREFSNGNRIAKIDEGLKTAETELIDKVKRRQEYEGVCDEIEKLRVEKERLQQEEVGIRCPQKREEELDRILTEFAGEVTEYDEALVRKLIEKVTVYDEKVTVEFKSGQKIDVTM